MNSNCNPIIGNSPENGNDIINNGGYAIYQEGSNDIDMAYNFFGTMDSVYIEDNLVRDKLDYQWDGRVNVFPVSMLPVAANTISGEELCRFTALSNHHRCYGALQLRQYQCYGCKKNRI